MSAQIVAAAMRAAAVLAHAGSKIQYAAAFEAGGLAYML